MDEPLEAVRLDVWLDVACLFKTRSQAQTACRGGKVEVDGVRAKPHRTVRIGNEVRITYGAGRRKIVKIQSLAATHVPKAEARELYEDLTPPPSPEEQELRRLQRLSTPPRRPPGAGAPSKKDRRLLRKIKEGQSSD